MCLRLCCDPHKLAYISALITAAEAVLFGALNLTLVLMSLCVIKPTDQPGGGIDKFWSWYFFDNDTCGKRHGDGFQIPVWISNSSYPLENRPHQTSVEANFSYQVTYLILHALWIISTPILIYGNARKRWGFYIPWLLISCTFIVMDVVLASFFIKDMTEVNASSASEGVKEVGPMIWMFSLYLRGFLFWFTNLGQTATVINAFCKSRHKRVKQERRRKKEQKKHEQEMSEATTAAAAQARAEAQAEIIQKTQSQSPPPSTHQAPVAQHHHPRINNLAHGEMAQDHHGRMPQDHHGRMPQDHHGRMPQDHHGRMPQDHHGGMPQDHHGRMPQDPHGGMPQDPYAQMYPNPHHYEPERIPNQSKAPTEVRPFSYINPGFRPGPNDILGMKKNPSGWLGATKGQGYFTAVPPKDYDDDDGGPSAMGLPRVNINMSISGGTPYLPTAPRDEDFHP